MAIAKVNGQHVYKNETNGVTPQNQAAPNQQAGYTPGAEVTQAQNKLAAAENNKPAAYQQGSAVTQAQSQLNQLMAGKPQGYTSKYGSQLNSILEQIQNPDKFNWSFDGDELFKYYADLYSQNGKQASMDAMGQAAALTGGYGNSYAQQVGNQAYDEWMRNLYDKGMDLRDRAYQQYQDQRADLYNRYGVLQGADESEYGRYRDTVQDWNADRDYWTGRVDTESDRDYNRYRDTVADYRDERDYLAGRYDTAADRDYNRYADERDYNRGVLESDRAYNEDVRRYDQDFEEEKRRYDQDFNWKKAVDERDFNWNKDVDERDFNWKKDTDERDFNWNKAVDERDFEWKKSVDQRDFEEQVREFEKKMDWENMSNDQKYASDLALQMLSMGLMPSEAMLRAAEISWADAQVLMNAYQQMLAAGGGSGGNPGGKKSEYYYDDRGNVYTKDENGNAVWVPDDQVDKNGTFIKEDGVEGTKAKIVSQLEEGDKAPKNAGSPSDFLVGNTTKKTTKTPTLTDEQKNAIKKKGK